MVRSALLFSLLLAPCCAFAQSKADGIDFFERKIRPVLVNQCYGCHSAEAQKTKKLRGGLFLDSRAGVMKGGESGPVLVPGKPADSLLLKALHHDGELRMPPKGKLTPEVIADFSRWIAMGAPDPREGKELTGKREIDIDKGRDYWAFGPLKSAVPAVKDAAWPRTDVDRFILSRLEEKGLRPSGVVDRERLIRRLTFDLWGLPPSPADIEAFVNDKSADAYEKLIDRLLASPRYGERWARHWLDVARFAESGGYEFDGDRPGAYLYRDFVIKALNQDMPFDEFVRLQVAGDRLRPGDLEATAATGFLVAGPFPGQVTAKTRERIRYDHLDDMISTVGSAFLGLSLGCVRCHEHKYDPIPQKDYYHLIACLANTDSTKPKLDPNPEATRKAKQAFDAEHETLTKRLDEYQNGPWKDRFAAWLKTEQAKPRPTWLVLDAIKTTSKRPLTKQPDASLQAEGKPQPGDAYTLVFHTHQQGITALRLQALAGKTSGDFLLTDVAVTAAPLVGKDKAVNAKLRAGAVTQEKKGQPLSFAVDADKKTGWAAGSGATAALDFETPVGFKDGTALTVVLRFDGGPALERFRLAITVDKDKPGVDATDDLQHGAEAITLLAGGALSEKNRLGVAAWHRRFDKDLDDHLAAVEKHAASEGKPALIEAFVAGDVGRSPVYFLGRGEVDRKGGMSSPGFVQVLMTGAEKEKRWVSTTVVGKKEVPTEPRIALGKWLTDAENGAGRLLARVIVNRLWQHHLGRGIVATPNDFGSQGEAPTHPELLDHLASELIKNGWRLKPIHRLIVRSAVYQQGNDVNDAAVKLDPQINLWWRRPARRLEAEAIRDSLLAVSGDLDATMFGAGTLDETVKRRSIYLRVKRSQPIPMLALFDAPEGIQSIAVRPTTTVPTQALALMNSPFVRQRAEKLAAAIRPKTLDGLPQAIDQAYRTALGRRPTEPERVDMAAFIVRQRDSYAANPRALDLALADFCQALLCSNEFVFVD